MTGLDDGLQAIIGKRPTFMQPPSFAIIDTSLAVLKKLQYQVIQVDLDTNDWKRQTPKTSNIALDIVKKAILDGNTICNWETVSASPRTSGIAVDLLMRTTLLLQSVHQLREAHEREQHQVLCGPDPVHSFIQALRGPVGHSHSFMDMDQCLTPGSALPYGLDDHLRLPLYTAICPVNATQTRGVQPTVSPDAPPKTLTAKVTEIYTSCAATVASCATGSVSTEIGTTTYYLGRQCGVLVVPAATACVGQNCGDKPAPSQSQPDRAQADRPRMQCSGGKSPKPTVVATFTRNSTICQAIFGRLCRCESCRLQESAK
ncbi:hypothetical protein HIM_08790 [Hirsutella minnesotensis 3608]|uniref:Uncharacterized protein n=1 Tax=Hirsutella minnesotensis 3608 TaxID=1043627 RepID=A0A0F8A3H1_9HYPO|nr:hypothetical protein HIM_08790 [Hirsutella minnesotensis 3608]